MLTGADLTFLQYHILTSSSSAAGTIRTRSACSIPCPESLDHVRCCTRAGEAAAQADKLHTLQSLRWSNTDSTKADPCMHASKLRRLLGKRTSCTQNHITRTQGLTDSRYMHVCRQRQLLRKLTSCTQHLLMCVKRALLIADTCMQAEAAAAQADKLRKAEDKLIDDIDATEKKIQQTAIEAEEAREKEAVVIGELAGVRCAASHRGIPYVIVMTITIMSMKYNNDE